MSQSLSIPGVLPNERVPLGYFSFTSANSLQTQVNQRTLIIADTYNTVPEALVPVQSTPQIESLCGLRSPAAKMVDTYSDNDPQGTLYLLPMTHATGATEATGGIAFTGTATAAGGIYAYLGAERVVATVNVGDTATVVANNLATAVNAVPDLPLFSGSSSAGTTNLTASNYGLSAGKIDVRLNYQGPANGEILPAGLTAVVTPMSGGVANPDISQIGTILGDQNFDFIVCQYSDATSLASLTALENDQSGRWAPARKVYGHAFVGDVDTYANLLTKGEALNDKHLTVWGCFDTPTPEWEMAAAMTGAAAVSLRADPPRPLQTLQVQDVMAPPLASQFTRNNEQALLSGGIALPSFDQGGNTYILRAVTTYQFNALGQPDQSYLDVETLFTLALWQRTVDSAISQKYGRMKLADNGTKFGAGVAIVTPNDIRAELIAIHQQMELDGTMEDTAAFAAGLIVVRNDADPSRVDAFLDPYFVSGLRIFAALTAFSLNSPAAAAA